VGNHQTKPLLNADGMVLCGYDTKQTHRTYVSNKSARFFSPEQMVQPHDRQGGVAWMAVGVSSAPVAGSWMGVASIFVEFGFGGIWSFPLVQLIDTGLHRHDVRTLLRRKGDQHHGLIRRITVGFIPLCIRIRLQLTSRGQVQLS